MSDHESDYDHHSHPVGPEVDDSGNPTAANPEDAGSAGHSEFGPGDAGSTDAGDTETGGTETGSGERPRSTAGREMLIQLQQMIDTIALQTSPVMRDVAAKAAELAAVAGEKAGPFAHRAAAVTESVGQRVAARSKDVAADLRRRNETTTERGPDEPDTA